jgi:hypothetical protein
MGKKEDAREKGIELVGRTLRVDVGVPRVRVANDMSEISESGDRPEEAKSAMSGKEGGETGERTTSKQ